MTEHHRSIVLIACGGREYRLTKSDKDYLDSIHFMFPIKELRTGGCRGADLDAEAWARENHIPVRTFPADWEKHGKAAGPIRNGEMLAGADGVVAFPGGRGTADMLKQAGRARLLLWNRAKPPPSEEMVRLQMHEDIAREGGAYDDVEV